MADLTFSEAQGVIDGSDSRSEQYWNNSNPELVGAVRAAYERQFPGELDQSTPEQFRTPPPGYKPEQGTASSQDNASDWNPANGFDPQFDWSREQSDAALRAELGGDYDRQVKAGEAAYNQLFSDFPDRRFLQQLVAFIGHHPAGLKLLLHVGGKMNR